jgi:Ca2+/H+ antiporter
MMLLGRLVRGALSGSIVGPLYIAVGTALCVSSRRSWTAWREARRGR